MGEISITKLLVVAALIILVFGTKNYARWVETWVRLSKASRKP